MWGLWGRPRLRPGRRRCGTPRQQRHRLRRRRCRSALPTHSPPGVAAPRGSRCRSSLAPRQAAPRALGRLKAAVRGRGRALPPHSSRRCGGRQSIPPRALAAQAPPSPRFARGGARGTPPAGGNAGRSTGRQGQGKRRAGGSAAPASALPAGIPASEGQPWRVSRPVRASRPFSFW